MFRVKKTIEIAGSHCLDLPYESKCREQHGHNWLVTIYCQRNGLNDSAMVIDFSEIKKIVDQLDHKNINDVLQKWVSENEFLQPSRLLNSTAESIAFMLCFKIPYCYKVKVRESSGNVATYKKEPADEVRSKMPIYSKE